MNTLYLNSYDRIVFELQLSVPLDQLCRYDQITVFLCHNNKKYLVCPKYDALYVAWDFKIYFDNLLAGKKKLNTEFFSDTIKTKDLGYLDNLFLLWREGGRSDLDSTFLPMMRPVEKHTDWIGSSYGLWTSIENLDCWLYELDDKFFIRLTQMYPWMAHDPVEGEEHISFEEFMANYAPLLTVEIPRQTLEQWRDQAHDLMEQILANEKKYNRWFTEEAA